MEHDEAVRHGFAERYIHRQLTAVEMDEFEQHFFACPECAEEVRWLAMFEDNARRAARTSDAAVAMLVELDPAAEGVCPPLISQPVVLLLPPGDWAEVALESSDGVERFRLPLTGGQRSVVLPARELTPGVYRVIARRTDDSRASFPLCVT